MKYIALDCHKQYDHATMIDTETGEIKSKRLAHIKEEFREFIGDRTGTRMVIESCCALTSDWRPPLIRRVEGHITARLHQKVIAG